MPIYDYACSACGKLTEVIHGIHDAPPRFCPACGAGGTLRKAIAAPAVHFKGSGWAKKDRRATSTPGKAKARSDSETTTPTATGDAPAATASGTSSSTTTSTETGTGGEG